MDAKDQLGDYLKKIDEDLNLAKDGLLKNERLYATKFFVEDGLKELSKKMDERSQLSIEKTIPMWRLQPRHGFFIEKDKAMEMLAPLRALIIDLIGDDLQMASKQEVVIEAGKPYDGRRYLRAIFGEADTSIFIRDSYLRPEILDVLIEFLTENPSLEVRLLLGENERLAPFKASLDSFKSQYPSWNVSSRYVKKENKDHPRYILIDSKNIFNPDHSLDRWGKETVNIHQLIDSESVAKANDFLDTEWRSGMELE